MLGGLFSFILLIVILVFVHELGHYSFARLFGVRVNVFSIGFGSELFGINDRYGTRWKISAIPLGGYVKMFGDAGPSSVVPTKAIARLSDGKKQQTFFYKNFWQKFLIILGGPLFNYLFSFILLTGFFYNYGKITMEPVIGEVIVGSPADKAGLQVDDRILEADGEVISDFNQLRAQILLSNGQSIKLKYKRRSTEYHGVITPMQRYDEENKMYFPVIGIVPSGNIKHSSISLLAGMGESISSIYQISYMTLRSLGQIMLGTRSIGELRGSFTMANESKKSISRGWIDFMLLLATLSVNLGLINLLPIPILDGGHLVIMTMKKIVGKMFSEVIEKYLYLLGGAIIIFLIVISTSNDIKSLFL